MRSSNSSERYTPEHWIQFMRYIMQPELLIDVATSEAAQKYIKADIYYTRERSALAAVWPVGDVFANAPGEPTGRMVRDFWKRCSAHYEAGRGSVFWIGFQLGQLAGLQGLRNAYSLVPSPLDHLTCVLRDRIDWIDGSTMRPMTDPPHHNYITLMSRRPGARSRFLERLAPLGVIVDRRG